MTRTAFTPRFRRLPFAFVCVWTVATGCEESPAQGRPEGEAASGIQEVGTVERWTTGSPESQGIDPTVLRDLESRIDAGDFGLISSLIVVRNGVMVFERYWDGWNADEVHAVNSVTKSVTSLAVGVAVGEGLLSTLDASILALLPEYDDVDGAAAKEAITLRDVLQMRTGLEWDELSTNYANAGNPVRALTESADWIDFVLSLPLTSEPGTSFTYNSGVSMLMAAVLTRATNAPAEQYVAARLFAPLGIDDWLWETGPAGLTNSGWGLHLRPRDMTTLGEMWLAGGSWEGQGVVPAAWLDVSSEAATRFVDGTGYGYQWWLGVEENGVRPVAAWGYGGQFIVVIPGLDVVVVSTAENFAGGGFTPYTLADVLYQAVGRAIP